MASPFNPDVMRERFHELGRLREDILAQTKPMREARDAAFAVAEAEWTTKSAEIRALEATLFDMDNERAVISRALAGATGEPPVRPAPAQAPRTR